jgi:cobaltochelatase CobS
MKQIGPDEFRTLVRDTMATCMLCNFRSYSLVSHVREKHNLSPGQYAKAYPGERLASPVVGELMRRVGRVAATPEQAKGKNLARVVDVFPGMLGMSQDARDKHLESLGKKMPACPDGTDYVPEIDMTFLLEGSVSEKIAFAVTRGTNLYLEGPTGCGKTEVIRQVHARMGRPVLRVNMNGDVTMANFLGQTHVNKAGTYFKEGFLPTAMRLGVTLLVDEIDYTPPHIAAVLNPILEGGRQVHIPESNEVLKAEPGFTVLATANTGGKGDLTGTFTGTEVLNTAFLDRFSMVVKTDYLKETDEVNMLTALHPDKEELVMQMVSVAGQIRQAFANGNLALTLSTRKLREFFIFADSFSQVDAMKLAVLDWLDNDDLGLVLEILKRCGIKTAEMTR